MLTPTLLRINDGQKWTKQHGEVAGAETPPACFKDLRCQIIKTAPGKFPL
jgi:hypothetical protein